MFYVCMFIFEPVCVLLTMFKSDKIQNKFKLVDPILIFKVGKGVKKKKKLETDKEPFRKIIKSLKLPL